MNRRPMNGRRAPLERRKGLDTSGGGLVRRRAPLPRTATPTASRTIRQQRRPELDVPQATRDELRIRSRGGCEAGLADNCTRVATDVHHRKRRRDGGHAITNLLDLCRPCHAYAHSAPNVARLAGVIVSVYEDPADVRVAVWSRLAGAHVPALLTADGGYLIGDPA